MPKRKIESEDEKSTKKARAGPAEYDFFHEKPESAKKETPMILACNGEQYNVFPQILGKFANRFEHVEHQNRTYINLDALECRGVEVFANWAMDHQKPFLIAVNGDEGNIIDDVVDCYITALRLRATLLCDLIIYQACEIGKEHELIVRHSQINKIYAETKRSQDGLREFISSVVAYQRRNGLANAIAGRDLEVDKQRKKFAALPQEFQFDLMNELSKNTAGQNPCYKPNRFLKSVHFFTKEKARNRAAAEKARLEQVGTVEEPLFVEESDDE
ncbi:hypothetical protein D6D19_05916 [Aureobasidium pullulans]|uniref:Uncharacterized protein n=1 Tax=Aureobasidium pullulans TaxID=5580 RepID=A0A4S9A2D9_AURPU|nr:hypothetical protein D6D19_05916 [Aureobasidium pullulans]